MLIQVVAQKHPADCGIAALSMLLGVHYDAVLIAVGRVQPKVLTRGLFLTEIIQIAKELGRTIKKSKYHPQKEGIVRVKGKGLGHRGGHVVVQVQLGEGWAIIDPHKGVVYPDPETYFAIGVEPTGMLVENRKNQ
jgi:ABC-type bacteriocin/lantibiotic exporter with double-glycine peptidase domain